MAVTGVFASVAWAQNATAASAGAAACARFVPANAPEPVVRRVQVSSGVQASAILNTVRPVYPDEARRQAIQGSVRFAAVVSRGGKVIGLSILRGPTQLVVAACEAVSQWEYRPTLLNGSPVEVATEIEVNFTLN